MKKIVLLCLTIVLISYNYLFGFSAGFMGSGAAKNAGGGPVALASCSGPLSGTGSDGCLFRETFEGSNDCGSWGTYETCDNAWTYGAGLEPDYTTSAISGSRSLFGDNVSENAFTEITDSDEVYVATAIKWSALPSSDNTVLKLTTANGATSYCHLRIYSTNQMLVQNDGGTQQQDSVALSVATVYYFMLRGKIGTGANAECQGYISTNGSSWTDGTLSNDGTWQVQLPAIKVEGTTNTDKVLDDIRVSTTSINYW